MSAPNTSDSILEELSSNPRIVEAATAPVFTHDECNEIVAACEPTSWREIAPPETTSAVRHKSEQPLPGGNTGWVGERIAAKVAEINDEVYKFRLLGLEDPVRVFSYRAEAAGQFHAHIDLSRVQPLRKLTFSLLLSDPGDFAGGDLMFSMGAFTEAKQRGAIAVFPSFFVHEVARVTAGHRIAIVGWALGPSFV